MVALRSSPFPKLVLIYYLGPLNTIVNNWQAANCVRSARNLGPSVDGVPSFDWPHSHRCSIHHSIAIIYSYIVLRTYCTEDCSEVRSGWGRVGTSPPLEVHDGLFWFWVWLKLEINVLFMCKWREFPKTFTFMTFGQDWRFFIIIRSTIPWNSLLLSSSWVSYSLSCRDVCFHHVTWLHCVVSPGRSEPHDYISWSQCVAWLPKLVSVRRVIT